MSFPVSRDLLEAKTFGKVPDRMILLSTRMSKLSRLVLTAILLISAISLWLIGSVIVIEIDSQQSGKVKFFTQNEEESRKRVDKICKILEKKKLMKIGNAGGEVGAKESVQVLEKARQEKLIRDNLIYFPELEEMWCLVPKAGSTSWSKAIIDRLNSDHLRIFVDPKSNVSLQVLLRQNYGSINKKMYEEAVKSDKIKKVLLVRHPFSRIVSAYENKLKDRKAGSDSLFFFQRYGLSMNRNFRTNKKLNKKKEPTFDEFVQYLINTNTLDYDEHWMPISLMCGLCHVRYDHIIFLEDLQENAEFHLRSLGFPERYSFPMENSSRNKDFHQRFQNVSNSKKIKLLTKYQDDFRLFGYSFLKHYV